jgi:cardiolipin synthase
LVKLDIPPGERRIWTVSNVFTFSRILILPLILILMRAPSSAENKTYLAVLVAWGFASDFLDGYFARKFNQVTVLGKILDPVSDKIVTFFIVLFCLLYRAMPVWLVSIIIARDVLILAMATIVMRTKQIVTVSNIYGKWAVTFIGLLIVSYMFEISVLHLPLTIIALTSIFVSLFVYAQNFFHMLHT